MINSSIKSSQNDIQSLLQDSQQNQKSTDSSTLKHSTSSHDNSPTIDQYTIPPLEIPHINSQTNQSTIKETDFNQSHIHKHDDWSESSMSSTDDQTSALKRGNSNLSAKEVETLIRSDSYSKTKTKKLLSALSSSKKNLLDGMHVGNTNIASGGTTHRRNTTELLSKRIGKFHYVFRVIQDSKVQFEGYWKNWRSLKEYYHVFENTSGESSQSKRSTVCSVLKSSMKSIYSMFSSLEKLLMQWECHRNRNDMFLDSKGWSFVEYIDEKIVKKRLKNLLKDTDDLLSSIVNYTENAYVEPFLDDKMSLTHKDEISAGNVSIGIDDEQEKESEQKKLYSSQDDAKDNLSSQDTLKNVADTSSIDIGLKDRHTQDFIRKESLRKQIYEITNKYNLLSSKLSLLMCKLVSLFEHFSSEHTSNPYTISVSGDNDKTQENLLQMNSMMKQINARMNGNNSMDQMMKPLANMIQSNMDQLFHQQKQFIQRSFDSFHQNQQKNKALQVSSIINDITTITSKVSTSRSPSRSNKSNNESPTDMSISSLQALQTVQQLAADLSLYMDKYYELIAERADMETFLKKDSSFTHIVDCNVRVQHQQKFRFRANSRTNELNPVEESQLLSFTHKTISDAIHASKPGDTIIVREGIYNESLVIDKPLTILGATSSDRVVICSNQNSVIRIALREDYVIETNKKNNSTENSPDGEYSFGALLNEGGVYLAHLSIIQMTTDKTLSIEQIAAINLDKYQSNHIGDDSLQNTHQGMNNTNEETEGKGKTYKTNLIYESDLVNNQKVNATQDDDDEIDDFDDFDGEYQIEPSQNDANEEEDWKARLREEFPHLIENFGDEEAYDLEGDKSEPSGIGNVTAPKSASLIKKKKSYMNYESFEQMNKQFIGNSEDKIEVEGDIYHSSQPIITDHQVEVWNVDEKDINGSLLFKDPFADIFKTKQNQSAEQFEGSGEDGSGASFQMEDIDKQFFNEIIDKESKVTTIFNIEDEPSNQIVDNYLIEVPIEDEKKGKKGKSRKKGRAKQIVQSEEKRNRRRTLTSAASSLFKKARMSISIKKKPKKEKDKTEVSPSSSSSSSLRKSSKQKQKLSKSSDAIIAPTQVSEIVDALVTSPRSNSSNSILQSNNQNASTAPTDQNKRTEEMKARRKSAIISLLKLPTPNSSEISRANSNKSIGRQSSLRSLISPRRKGSEKDIKVEGVEEVIVNAPSNSYQETSSNSEKQSWLFCAITVEGSSSHCTIENCVLSGGIGSCIYVSNQASLSLRANQIYKATGNGITIDGSKCSLCCEDNSITNHSTSGIAIYGHTLNTSIRNNTIRSNAGDGIYISIHPKDSPSNNMQPLDSHEEVLNDYVYKEQSNSPYFKHHKRNHSYESEGLNISSQHQDKNIVIEGNVVSQNEMNGIHLVTDYVQLDSFAPNIQTSIPNTKGSFLTKQLLQYGLSSIIISNQIGNNKQYGVVLHGNQSLTHVEGNELLKNIFGDVWIDVNLKKEQTYLVSNFALDNK